MTYEVRDELPTVERFRALRDAADMPNAPARASNEACRTPSTA